MRTRSQAEQEVKFGNIKVNKKVVTKPGLPVSETDVVEVTRKNPYVGRAGLKLESAAEVLQLDFRGKLVLDVGSSTGGFTDYSLQRGAKKVIAVDVGTAQLHPSLHNHPSIELHEKTDIRDFKPTTVPDLVLIDVSFISLRQILPNIVDFCSPKTQIVAMLKPQFEAGKADINRGIIKNNTVRRQVIKDFESWTQNLFNIINKVDSAVQGSKGNVERFYLLKVIKELN